MILATLDAIFSSLSRERRQCSKVLSRLLPGTISLVSGISAGVITQTFRSSPNLGQGTQVYDVMSRLIVPIVSAPMHGASGAQLAGSVAKTGGLGFIGSGFAKEADQMQREYRKAVELSGDAGGAERVGIGLVGFTGDWLVDTAIALRPAAIWTSFGNYSAAASKINEAGVPLMVMVQSVEEAVRAAAVGAAAIVAQGSDSGGHGCGPTSTFCFVPEVLDALRQNGFERVPVLAAGGIADGRQVAAVIALGAAGAVMGTRFAVTNESMLSEEKKRRYLAAKAADTQRTRLFDDLGPVDWPTGVDGRVIGNTFSNTHGTVAPAEEEECKVVKEELAKGMQEGNLDVMPVWCGAGVGLIHSIDTAEDVVTKTWEEASERIALSYKWV